MIPLYKTVAPPKVVYRVSRSADPRELPAWRDILRYERGRYDDPNDGYRVSSHARTVAVFETGRDSGSFRAQLDVLAVAPADGDHVAMMSALGALLRSDEFSPLIAS